MKIKYLTALSILSILILILSSGCQMKASKASVIKPTPAVLSLFAEEAPAMAVAARQAVEAPAAVGNGGADVQVAESSSSSAVTTNEEVAPTPDMHRPETYSLNKGEWAFCIARRYNVNPIDLLSASGLSLESKPDVGFVLKIPQTGEWPESRFGHRYIREHPVMHQVAAGETLNTIACLYGDVDPGEIVEANELPEPYTITAGKMLRIP
ncbi:MAG: LysM domain-containing protein [Leptolinea sp.]